MAGQYAATRAAIKKNQVSTPESVWHHDLICYCMHANWNFFKLNGIESVVSSVFKWLVIEHCYCTSFWNLKQLSRLWQTHSFIVSHRECRQFDLNGLNQMKRHSCCSFLRKINIVQDVWMNLISHIYMLGWPQIYCKMHRKLISIDRLSFI